MMIHIDLLIQLSIKKSCHHVHLIKQKTAARESSTRIDE
jgi:hypothetical protein